jgi:hypothetical protein
VAVSPTHRFGQIIGEVLEATMSPYLQAFARQHKLYLDKKGDRACREGKKCTWKDLNGNKHDLDFVLERGGTATKQGIPAAFIETAWRSYTKHSRAKAQEIQGAIEPLSQTYRNASPFKGAVLAGEFTSGSVTQLESLGFTVVLFPTSTVLAAFKAQGIDAAFSEGTPDAVVKQKVDAYDALPQAAKDKIATDLGNANAQRIKSFIQSLAVVVARQIERIIILPLYGTSSELATVPEAITFIQRYNETKGATQIDRYEILIRYDNGNVIDGKFKDKASAVEFLELFHPVIVPGKAMNRKTRRKS